MNLGEAHETQGTIQFPAGTWIVEQGRSSVEFSVKHLLISTVRGHFDDFSGKIITSGSPIGTSVDAYVDVATLRTGDSPRDIFVLSKELLDVEKWPRMWIRGEVTGETPSGYLLDAEMSIRDTVRPVQFDVILEDTFASEGEGGVSRIGRVMLHAQATVNRKDFGLQFSPILESGGVIVADNVGLRLDISAIFDCP
ncbi:MAG: YceI family protein [Acidimicrobiales bacterium]